MEPVIPTIIYLESCGKRHEINLPIGLSLMEGAVKNGVDGIQADCGGACACATCHVYVAPEWVDRLPPMTEMEQGMLEFALDTNAESRLSCQIPVDDTMDGLIVTIPGQQY